MCASTVLVPHSVIATGKSIVFSFSHSPSRLWGSDDGYRIQYVGLGSIRCYGVEVRALAGHGPQRRKQKGLEVQFSQEKMATITYNVAELVPLIRPSGLRAWEGWEHRKVEMDAFRLGLMSAVLPICTT